MRASTVVSEPINVIDGSVYSSAIFGPRAEGVVNLFTVPLGQPIQRLGIVDERLFPVHTPLTTNMLRAASLGVSVGDAAFSELRLDFIGATLEDVAHFIQNVSYSLRVCAREFDHGAVRDLPKTYENPILCASDDDFKLTLETTSRFPDRIGPFLVRAVLSGKISREVR